MIKEDDNEQVFFSMSMWRDGKTENEIEKIGAAMAVAGTKKANATVSFEDYDIEEG